jgi:hypothetical protein
MDLRAWPKKWNDASSRWNDTSLSQFAHLPEYPTSRPWPLVGMLALGLVAGVVIGGYTVSQRSHLKRLSRYAHRMGDELAEMATEEVERPATTKRSNHRRKTAAEV